MGCGPSTDKPRRRRHHGGHGGASTRSQHDNPRVNQVVRPPRQNQQIQEEGEPERRKTSSQRTAESSGQRTAEKTRQSGFKIPKRRKEQLIPDESVFAKRDNWAQQVPKEHSKSVIDVARYLTHEAKNDLHRVRAFYRWMTLNICYDAESFITKVHRYPSDPASVLRYRISVCDGYAQLFEALCKAAAIPCRYVAGFSKGTNYDPDVPITERSFVNHAWNIVCVNGEWWPVDVTWGAGHMDNRNKFVWHYNELNFLTDPDVFILSHFPYMNDSLEYSAQFQLLKKPRTLEEFNLTVKPDRNGLEWGLELLTHTQCTIPVQGDVTIKFRTKIEKLTNISCNFNRKRTGEDFENCVILYQREGVYSAKVKPPDEGVYKLTLFGETEGMTKHQGLVSYIIHCYEADENAEPYPEHFGMWGPQPKAAECGFDEGINDMNVFLSEDGNLQFAIPLKERVDTMIRLQHSRKSTDLEEFVSEASNDKVMVVLARLPYKGYYKMQIFACDPDSGGNSYIPIAFFFIKCLKGLKSASPFTNSSEAQQFLTSESSKPRKKKKAPTKAPTPPPTPSEASEEEDEELEGTKPYSSKNAPSSEKDKTLGNHESDPHKDDIQQHRNGETEKEERGKASSDKNREDTAHKRGQEGRSYRKVTGPPKQTRKQNVSESSAESDEEEVTDSVQAEAADEEEDEDDNGDAEQRQSSTFKHSRDHQYRGVSTRVKYNDPYTGAGVRKVVPAVAETDEEEEDEETEEEKDDDDEKDGEKSHPYQGKDESDSPEHNPGERQSNNQEQEHGTDEDKEKENISHQRHVPYNPHQTVHRVSTVRPPKHQTIENEQIDEDESNEEKEEEKEENNDDDGDDGDDDDDDDDDDDESQNDQRNQRDSYTNPYNRGYLGPSYSDSRMYGQSRETNPYLQGGFIPPSISGDFGSQYPVQNAYTSLLSQRKVHRPY